MAARPRRRSLAPGFDSGHAVTLILKSYEEFLARSEGEEVGDAKAFAGRHAAGRAALAHVEHVVKVGALVGAADEAPDLSALVAEARAQLQDNDTDEEDEADDSIGGAG